MTLQKLTVGGESRPLSGMQGFFSIAPGIEADIEQQLAKAAEPKPITREITRPTLNAILHEGTK